ncbi:MAG TPA: radical SAM protein [Nitrospiraceae bacterium]|nr:radical SAM protein [Nitrospiraceae bacterium]
MATRVLLIIPPLTQLNTPYPATAYLTGFLKSRGYAVGQDSVPAESRRAGKIRQHPAPSESGPVGVVTQADVGIEMVLGIFCRGGLRRVFEEIRGMPDMPGEALQMLSLERIYLETIEPVIGFLQGRDSALASRICQGRFLPRGPRFATAQATSWRSSSTTDMAKHWATLYLEDLADLIQHTVSSHFALSRYAEQVGTSASSFDSVEWALAQPLTLTDQAMLDACWKHVTALDPAVVGLTVPFPGNLYGALRIAQWIKSRCANTKIVLGGGYANTELRRLSDPRVFDLVDFVTLDDGERPFLCILEHLAGKRDEAELKRTFMRFDGRVVFLNGAREPDFGMAELGTPTYAGLKLDQYLSILDTLNPMHRLWSDGHWNKLTVAHGCYWKQCTFCDVGLDYIGRYEASPSEVLADRIETLIAETGRRGFHFVDEAAPPAGLKSLALILLERGIAVSWWGNIRFEEAFCPDLCRLLAASGCVAVSAGLEVASDRLLAAMKKGITVEQTARVAAAFHAAGILVHAYLMYGFPGETIAETVESLERVRQLFDHRLIQSAFWHRFTATAHSPVGLDPVAHGVRITGPAFGGFAENDLTHVDPIGETPDWLGEGLRKALFAYKEGEGLRTDVRQWFDRIVRRPNVPRDWVTSMIGEREKEGRSRFAVRSARIATQRQASGERRFVWVGGTPFIEGSGRHRRVILPNRTEDIVLRLSADKAIWLVELIGAATPKLEKQGGGYPALKDVQDQYPWKQSRGFERLLRSMAWNKVREIGLVLV